jgi:hypothetical protein
MHICGNGRRKKCSDNVMSIIMEENKKNSMISLRKLSPKIKFERDIDISHVSVKNILMI